jgi:hypothetical protein
VSEVDLYAGDHPATGDIDIAGMQAGNEAANPLIKDWRAVKGDPERVGEAEDDRYDKGGDLAVSAAVRSVGVEAGDPMDQPRKFRRACRTHHLNSAASLRLCDDTPFQLPQTPAYSFGQDNRVWPHRQPGGERSVAGPAARPAARPRTGVRTAAAHDPRGRNRGVTVLRFGGVRQRRVTASQSVPIIRAAGARPSDLMSV